MTSFPDHRTRVGGTPAFAPPPPAPPGGRGNPPARLDRWLHAVQHDLPRRPVPGADGRVAPAAWPCRPWRGNPLPVPPSRLRTQSPAPAGDKYRSFDELAAAERPGVDFTIRALRRPSGVAIVAPHGGLIERGTSEIAWALAGDTYSAYSFDGTKERRNGDLHITSTRFDEPQCLALVSRSTTVLTVHGERSPGEVVFVGGRDAARCERLCCTLQDHGFVVRRHQDPALQGMHASNICNRGRTGAGIQLELSRGLRRALVDDTGPSQPPPPTQRLAAFCAAVRQALEPPDAGEAG